MQPYIVLKFCKARTVPFALKDAIEQKLNHLEQDGIIEKVSHSPARVVPVPKGDSHIRLYGDYKITINPMLETYQYLLSKPDSIFAKYLMINWQRMFFQDWYIHAYQQAQVIWRFLELCYN